MRRPDEPDISDKNTTLRDSLSLSYIGTVPRGSLKGYNFRLDCDSQTPISIEDVSIFFSGYTEDKDINLYSERSGRNESIINPENPRTKLQNISSDNTIAGFSGVEFTIWVDGDTSNIDPIDIIPEVDGISAKDLDVQIPPNVF